MRFRGHFIGGGHIIGATALAVVMVGVSAGSADVAAKDSRPPTSCSPNYPTLPACAPHGEFMTPINPQFLVSIWPTVGSAALTGSAAIVNAMMEDPT